MKTSVVGCKLAPLRQPTHLVPHARLPATATQ
jgi:hypothetical protein